jgi:hypothetical protein
MELQRNNSIETHYQPFPTLKTCKKCKTTKHIKMFYNSSSNKDGKSNQCKCCDSQKNKKLYGATCKELGFTSFEFTMNTPSKIMLWLNQTQHISTCNV